MSGNEAFLATTALSRFWNDDGPNLFLGQWCLPYGKKAEGPVLPYPFDDREKFEEAVRVCDGVYETALAALGKALNGIHGASRPELYWRILIGPWLLHYVSVVYERWLCLRSAMEGRDLSTKGLARESYAARADFNEFMEGLPGDSYNLQLYTQIGEQLGIRFQSREKMEQAPARRARSPLKSLASYLSSRLARGPSRVWCSNPRITPRGWLRLALKARAVSLNRIVPVLAVSRPALRPDLREGLGGLNLGAGEFPRVLRRTLPDNFPWRYLEGYRDTEKGLERLARRPPKALVISTPDYRSETLFLAARLKSEGSTRLVTYQHGGCFGMALRHPLEKHEKLVSDEYWSWGWTDGGAKPMPSLLETAGPRPGRGILYCGNGMSRYQYRLWSNPIGPQWLEVIRWRHRWLRGLDAKALDMLVVRLYPGDPYGWSELERLRDEFPKVAIDPGASSFPKSLRDCALFVCDTNHTTCLEALAMDKPAVLFWDEAFNELRGTAVPSFARLASAGVLHFSPEAAARKVNEVCGDPLAWWRRPEVRSAVKEFRSRFAGSAEKPLQRWEEELRRLAHSIKPPSTPIDAPLI